MSALLVAVLLAQQPTVDASGGVTPNALGCTGEYTTCTLAGCAIAVKECVSGYWGPCYCLHKTCNDGNACTVDGKDGIECTHVPVNVDDGNACTIDTCSPTTGITHVANTGATCNDNDLCTTGDKCTALATCAGTPKNVFDGNQCTADTCDPATGNVNPATPSARCDDGNACTEPDTCTAAKTCVGTPKPGLDDGVACTTDACNPTSGAITHTFTCAASATLFCHDKYGRVTKQVVCVNGQSCDASCP